MTFNDKDTAAIIRLLGPHGPHGLLAFAILVVVAGLVFTGAAPPLYAFCFGVLLYGMFGYFKGKSEATATRSKELEVELEREAIKAMALAASMELYNQREAHSQLPSSSQPRLTDRALSSRSASLAPQMQQKSLEGDYDD